MNFFSIFKRNLIFKLKKKINIDKDFFEKSSDLEKLFSFYETDKANFFGKNKSPGHGFSKFYEKYFSNLKNKKVNILEIGSYSGASAAAFAKYFINSSIFCLDLNLTKFIYKSNQIYPYGIDVTNYKMVENFLRKIYLKNNISDFDIIIDDGSHLLSHQLKSLNYFLKFVKKDGFYIVEDFKFPEYFKHLKDIDEPTLSDLIQYIRTGKSIKSNLITKETIELLKKNLNGISEHKGKKNVSDILFVKKLN